MPGDESACGNDLDLRDEFPLDGDLIYLNHAAVGVWPRRTAEAVKAFADQNMRRGAADYPRWMQVEKQLREQLARLIGAPSGQDVALVKNTSEGLSLIAMGLDWRRGDNVVSLRQEFPSNRIVWQALARLGVETRLVDLERQADPEAALIAMIDERTRLLSVSSVQYADGFRLDLEWLGEACRRKQVLFCIDAIQSLGALRFDVERYQADFVVADAHKWMLGPEGIALFYSRPAAREKLELLQYGWHMLERLGDFAAEAWRPAASARRFEPGSPNQLGIQALHASLSLLEEIGMDAVEAALLGKTADLRRWIAGQPRLRLLGSSSPARASGIVSFKVGGLDAEGHTVLYRRLMQAGVICALRGGGIRLSPHFYTPQQALEQMKQIVSALVAELAG